MTTTTTLTIRRPDDWHVHFRDGDMLKTVVSYTSKFFGRAIVMPNLVPLITTIEMAKSYRERIIQAVPEYRSTGRSLIYAINDLCYLTDGRNSDALIHGFKEGVFTDCKLYFACATTNSSHGVSYIKNIYPVLV